MLMANFFFYDLETSGFSARYDRIMQFAGQRTDMDLNPIGEPVNLLVKLPDDILPSPQAILTTKITPQATLSDGMLEPEFCKFFIENVATPGTIVTGYNSVRFDDEFIRHTLWRNFYPPYQWSFQDGRSRYDLLDPVRLTHALRPDGINWPTQTKQDPNDSSKETKVLTVKLEEMARANGFTNKHAHDALADVEALINLAKLIKNKQPKLWQFCLDHRSKEAVKNIISPLQPKPFVYCSGSLANPNKATVAIVIGSMPRDYDYLIWDLSYSAEDFASLSYGDIKKALAPRAGQDKDHSRLPIKQLSARRQPAVAPISTLDASSQERLGLNMDTIKKNLKSLAMHADLMKHILRAFAEQQAMQQTVYDNKQTDVEGELYKGFISDKDARVCAEVTVAQSAQLSSFSDKFNDARLPELLFHYQARNFPNTLSTEQTEKWQDYRKAKLQEKMPEYLTEINKAIVNGGDEFTLNELKLYAELIWPNED